MQTLGNAAVHFCGSRPSWWAGGALYQIISYYDDHHFLILINDNVDDDSSDADNDYREVGGAGAACASPQRWKNSSKNYFIIFQKNLSNVPL